MNSNESKEKNKYSSLSNDALDGIAAVILIAIAVIGVFYWLETMP
ncbi:MAG: hypothetical protein JWM09_1027 [Francisellaceae bacterium]|nr:hypothetical protein [Francisellaceae bacterium]